MSLHDRSLSEAIVAFQLAKSGPETGIEIFREIKELYDEELSRETVYAALRRLRGSGLIEHRPNPDNEKAKPFELTEKGWEEVESFRDWTSECLEEQ